MVLLFTDLMLVKACAFGSLMVINRQKQAPQENPLFVEKKQKKMNDTLLKHGFFPARPRCGVGQILPDPKICPTPIFHTQNRLYR